MHPQHTVIVKPETYKSRFAQPDRSPDIIRADKMEESNSPNIINRGGYLGFRKMSNNSRTSSRNRSLSNKPPRAYQTKNFFNQTMTQMVQGKNNELQPLVNRRKMFYQQVPRIQTRHEAMRYGYSYHEAPVHSMAHPLNVNTQFSLERSPLLMKQDEEMPHDFSHDIQVKINGKDETSKIHSAKFRSSLPDKP